MSTAPSTLFQEWRSGLDLDEVLLPEEVFSAHDERGARYLIAHTSAATWLCAPISERALHCVASGRAELRAVFAHTTTGMVERLTVWGARVCQESTILCGELTDDLLPRPGVRLGRQVRCA
jgi:hypothetical protein